MKRIFLYLLFGLIMTANAWSQTPPSQTDTVTVSQSAVTQKISHGNGEDVSEKSAEFWISLAAAVVAVLAIIISLWQFFTSEGREKSDELREIIVRLINLRFDYDKKARLGNEEDRVMIGDQFGRFFSLYLETAEQLVEQIDKKLVSSVAFYTIGREFEVEGEISRAIKYYKLAFENAKALSIKSREAIFRALGDLYYRPGPFQNIESGQRYYKDLLDLFGNSTDEYLIFLKGFNYKEWATRELYVDNFELSLEYLFASQQVFSALTYYPEKPFALSNVYAFMIDEFHPYTNEKGWRANSEKTKTEFNKIRSEALNFYNGLPPEYPARSVKMHQLSLIGNYVVTEK
jgi:hypothetical protein